ncbi:MAG: hypothetical protein HOP03_13330 [Lysobacter sp.]|nr:hypothetical protein [Lysobacter sp.]
MIIPEYWAEARLQHRERKRQITVRRFGWSDVGEAEAQAHADVRVREALERVLAGEKLPRRERRVAYNGADGMPIREEIVDRAGDTVITRNGYGALCLNTPNVLFADIDFAVHARPRQVLASMIFVFATIVVVMIAGLHFSAAPSLIVGFFASLLLGVPLPGALRKSFAALQGGHEQVAIRRVRRFLAAHPSWSMRVYRTPAGLRLLAMHRLFDPREVEVKACFDALGVDPMYARMCFNQNCFRARISPKPWRMGLQRMRPPYSAAWRPEHAGLPARRQWIETYEREAQAYAACRFVEMLGSGASDPHADAVRELHDAFCRADQDLKIA